MAGGGEPHPFVIERIAAQNDSVFIMGLVVFALRRRLARETRSRKIWGGKAYREGTRTMPAHSSRRVVDIGLILFGSLMVATCTAPARAQESFSVSMNFVGTVLRSDMDELNEAFAASGHTTVPAWDLMPGTGLSGSFEGFRFNWDIGVGVAREVRHDASGWQGRATQLQVFVDAGHDILRYRGWSFYGLGGAGYGQLLLDTTASHPPFAEDLLQGLEGEVALRQSSGLVRGTIGIERLFDLVPPRFPGDRLAVEGPIVGVAVHLGYQQAVTVGDWRTEDRSLGGSPSVDPSGPFLAVVFRLLGGGSMDYGEATQSCGPAPPHGSWQARGLACVPSCREGYGNCDGEAANGCEASFASDARNCGTCGKVCALAHATSACESRVCVRVGCERGWANCDGVSTSGCGVDLSRDRYHCGGCGNHCGDDEDCRAGKCVARPPVEIAE